MKDPFALINERLKGLARDLSDDGPPEVQRLLSFDTPKRERLARSPRDGQRSKVYAAEREAFSQLPNAPRSEEAWNRYAKLISDSKAAHKHYGKRRPITIHLRGRSWSRAWAGGVIWIGSDHVGHEWVVLHEAAHAINRRGAPHGREFCAAYLDLVYEFLGRTWGDALKKSFREHKVKFKPKKELSPERRAQLARER